MAGKAVFRAGRAGLALGICALSFIFLAASAVAQDAKKDPKAAKDDKTPELTTLKIEVTGGDKDTPISNASVYVRFEEPRFLLSPRKMELDLKTDLEGKTKVPGVPRIQVMIQVVKDGWKPFGKYYDLTKPVQTIKIKMQPPPHWY